jgi:hypothetical protein
VIFTLTLHTGQEFKAICSSEEVRTDHTDN